MDNLDPLKYTDLPPEKEIVSSTDFLVQSKKPEVFWPLLLWSLFAILIIFVGLIITKPIKNTLQNIQQTNQTQTQAVEKSSAVSNIEFPAVSIEGHSGFVWDIQNKKVLYQKNSTDQLPLASITKVMVAIVALDIVPPLTTIEITPASLEIEGNHDLVAGEKWILKDLIKYSLTISSNNGMNAIASAIGAFEGNNTNSSLDSQYFVSIMNKYSKIIGLYNTKFFNETGLDLNGNISGAYSTAEDAAKLLAYAIQKQPEVFESTTKKFFESKSLSNINHRTVNTNEVVGQIPGLIGSKTGYTDLAGGNLVVAFDADLNRPIIISVLGSSREGRFSDVLTLVKATQKYLGVTQK